MNRVFSLEVMYKKAMQGDTDTYMHISPEGPYCFEVFPC